MILQIGSARKLRVFESEMFALALEFPEVVKPIVRLNNVDRVITGEIAQFHAILSEIATDVALSEEMKMPWDVLPVQNAAGHAVKVWDIKDEKAPWLQNLCGLFEVSRRIVKMLKDSPRSDNVITWLMNGNFWKKLPVNSEVVNRTAFSGYFDPFHLPALTFHKTWEISVGTAYVKQQALSRSVRELIQKFALHPIAVRIEGFLFLEPLIVRRGIETSDPCLRWARVHKPKAAILTFNNREPLVLPEKRVWHAEYFAIIRGTAEVTGNGLEAFYCGDIVGSWGGRHSQSVTGLDGAPNSGSLLVVDQQSTKYSENAAQAWLCGQVCPLSAPG
ncbi:MAG TPA: hypothetical protein VGJ33_18800 [Candidatus Angelobacter sp.]|jgi:hypothetical protein